MYPKLTTQQYRNFGGINEKSSDRTLELVEFRRLSNVDFSVPNALAKRPGSTQAASINTSGPIYSMFEYQKLSGASYLVFSSDTALFYLQSSATYAPIYSGFNNSQPWDMLTFVDTLFAANGQTFLTWDGTTLRPYGLPTANPLNALGGFSVNSTFFGVSAPMAVWLNYTYLRNDGFLGPMPIENARLQNLAPLPPAGITVSQFTTPSGFGISAIALYAHVRQYSSSVNMNFSLLPSDTFYLVQYFTPGTTVTSFLYSLTTWGSLQNGIAFTGSIFNLNTTYTPKYIELNQNVLFMSGFSASPSEVFHSDVGQPEVVQPENSFEVRTNDGDRITGMKWYYNQLLIFKRNSFHKIIGDNPNNYELLEITNQYGALSNKAIVEYQTYVAFLDKKAIVRYDGNNWDVISTDVEQTLRKINITAAIEKAYAENYSFRNQLWFAIPIDGSTQNNIVLVYDYIVDGWTFFEGFNVASLAQAQQAEPYLTMYRGNYSGKIFYHSPSFLGDNGQGFTIGISTYFEIPDGYNVTNMWRRLFTDFGTVLSETGPAVNVLVRADYNTTQAQFTSAIYMNQYQTRLDFGVEAKSAAFEYYNYSASYPMLLSGYAASRRFLRNV